jgi:hypothetical protein
MVYVMKEALGTKRELKGQREHQSFIDREQGKENHL